MPLLQITEGDDVLHIHSYGKAMTKTSVTHKSEWSTKVKSGVTVEKHDKLIRLDDPALKSAKLKLQRKNCASILHYASSELPENILEKLDEINNMITGDLRERVMGMLNGCGAIQKESSFLADEISE